MHGSTFGEVPRVSAPELARFRREFLRRRRPVIVTGVVDRWPISRLSTLEQLAERYGEAQMVVVGTRDDRVDVTGQRGAVFSRRELRSLVAALRGGDRGAYVSTPLDAFPARFAGEYSVPIYCADAPFLQKKIWLGGAGTVMPLHFDLKHNFYCLVQGRKRVILYPASQTRRLYPWGLFSRAPNFARVDPEAPDLERFPRFAAARALACTLEAGEALFIPSLFWHHVRTLADGFAFALWFGGAGYAALARGSTWFRRLRGMHQGEWG